MNKKIILLFLLVIIVLVGLVGYQLFFTVSSTSEEVVPQQEFTPLPEVTNVREPKTIVSDTGVNLSAEPILAHTKTTVASTDFYQNSDNTDIYDIFYDEVEGSILVLLYDEDLLMARQLAEKQLQMILPYSEKEICAMQLKVQTNELVSPVYSGINLGLSFCPESVKL